MPLTMRPAPWCKVKSGSCPLPLPGERVVNRRSRVTGQIVRHAGQIEAVRVRFAAVHQASAAVVGDETVYGRLCRWVIHPVLEKHARQDELVSYVEENLRLIVAGLYDLYGVR